MIYVTKDDGEEWTNITKGLPKDLWVTRVTASMHKSGRVYAALNGYRWDNYEAFVYCSDDYGKNWKRLGSNLPFEPVNVIKEDTENGDILYLGTDAGLYVSTDRGNSFYGFKGNLPNVPIHDLAVHPKENELIAGTHGRSVYIADIKPIREFKKLSKTDKIAIFSIRNIFYNDSWGERGYDWKFNTPDNLVIPFYNTKKQNLTYRIATDSGKTMYEESAEYDKGINYINYNLTIQETFREGQKNKGKQENKIKDSGKHYLTAGKYYVEISDGTGVSKQKFEIRKRE